eukprot:gnl/Trimastix_PCT/880.p1 GENE.gnl/Trimastix_PCT/880~~gnl/Trimastix_PCT/880.p1  ORF type:complete len:639 (+),score=142.40 gnl/Trimastix_PCT/880:101-2017(+)
MKISAFLFLLVAICLVSSRKTRNPFHLAVYRNGAMVTQDFDIPFPKEQFCVKVALPLRPSDPKAIFFCPEDKTVEFMSYSLANEMHTPIAGMRKIAEELLGQKVEVTTVVGNDEVTLKGRLMKCGADPLTGSGGLLCLKEKQDDREILRVLAQEPIMISARQWPARLASVRKPSQHQTIAEVCFRPTGDAPLIHHPPPRPVEPRPEPEPLRVDVQDTEDSVLLDLAESLSDESDPVIIQEFHARKETKGQGQGQPKKKRVPARHVEIPFEPTPEPIPGEEPLIMPHQARHAVGVYPTSGITWEAAHYLKLDASGAQGDLVTSAVVSTSMGMQERPNGEILTSLEPESLVFVVGDLKMPSMGSPNYGYAKMRGEAMLDAMPAPMPAEPAEGGLINLGEIEVRRPLPQKSFPLPRNGVTSVALAHTGEKPLKVARRLRFHADQAHHLARVGGEQGKVHPDTVLSVLNTKNNSLGEGTIPAGRVLVYKTSPLLSARQTSQRPCFLGTDRIQDTPVGTRFEITTGKAPNTVCEWSHQPQPSKRDDKEGYEYRTGRVTLRCSQEHMQDATERAIREVEIIDTIPIYGGSLASVAGKPNPVERNERTLRWLVRFPAIKPTEKADNKPDTLSVVYEYKVKFPLKR